VEPCNQCESCVSFTEYRTFNIHELDAASNNSVDDIRNLTDQVRVPPQVGRYSIYIIDEVHMLSAQAFNAFLKTLEEPPLHAIFILATTEKHKIIPTILSRCQIFDFNRIKISDITKYLKQISVAEKIDFEEDALTVIARKADGAMRDALSIFDQIVSFSGGVVRYADVINNLNILDYEYYFSITEAILSHDVSKILLTYNEIQAKGFDGHNFISGLSSHFRDLLVARDTATLELLDTGSGIRERYLQQSGHCSADFLYQALELSNLADQSYKASKNQRLHVELYLIRLANITSGGGINTPTGQDTEPLNQPEPGEISRIITGDKTAGNHDNQVSPAAGEKPDIVEETETLHGEQEEKTDEMTTIYTPTVKIPSIKDTLNGISKNKETIISSNHEIVERNTAFTDGQLHEYWLDFAESISKNKPRMYSFLKNHLPELQDQFQIIVNFNNSAQMDEFVTEIKKELTDYLAQALDNNVFSIIPRLPEKSDAGKKLYTQEDKYEYLRQKNPAIEKMKKDFNLDFE
jgi:DNA polymerase-3 subunit gamma/tau